MGDGPEEFGGQKVLKYCDGQCCQVLKRLLRQLNENLPLSDEKPPLTQIFKKSATFPLFLASNFALTLEN
jgi:hypothetical protein